MSDDVLYLRNDSTGTMVKIARRVSGKWFAYGVDVELQGFLNHLDGLDATTFGLISEMEGPLPKDTEDR